MPMKFDPVPMPANVSFNTNKDGGIYVYLPICPYRNENGQKVMKKRMIGKALSEDGPLIPNDNYFIYFDEQGVLREDVVTREADEFRKGLKDQTPLDKPIKRGKRQKRDNVFDPVVFAQAAKSGPSQFLDVVFDTLLNLNGATAAFEEAFGGNYILLKFFAGHLVACPDGDFIAEALKDKRMPPPNPKDDQESTIKRLFPHIGLSDTQLFLTSWCQCHLSDVSEVSCVGKPFPLMIGANQQEAEEWFIKLYYSSDLALPLAYAISDSLGEHLAGLDLVLEPESIDVDFNPVNAIEMAASNGVVNFDAAWPPRFTPSFADCLTPGHLELINSYAMVYFLALILRMRFARYLGGKL